jgi:hypothetical protein
VERHVQVVILFCFGFFQRIEWKEVFCVCVEWVCIALLKTIQIWIQKHDSIHRKKYSLSTFSPFNTIIL